VSSPSPWTDEDLFSPQFCRDCRQKAPRAELSSGQGLCLACCRRYADQVTGDDALLQPSAPPPPTEGRSYPNDQVVTERGDAPDSSEQTPSQNGPPPSPREPHIHDLVGPEGHARRLPKKKWSSLVIALLMCIIAAWLVGHIIRAQAQHRRAEEAQAQSRAAQQEQQRLWDEQQARVLAEQEALHEAAERAEAQAILQDIVKERAAQQAEAQAASQAVAQLRRGMTPAEVYALLGPPRDIDATVNHSGEREEEWYYKLPNGDTLHVSLDDHGRVGYFSSY